VPGSSLLGGEEGRGFGQLMDRSSKNPMTGAGAVAFIDRAPELTIAW
jgi:hypothetical protein